MTAWVYRVVRGVTVVKVGKTAGQVGIRIASGMCQEELLTAYGHNLVGQEE